MFFGKKMWSFWKNAEGTKFALEFDWISNISQRVQFLGFCWKQFGCVIRKKNLSKIAAFSKFAVECDWISKNLQSVRKLGVIKNGFFANKNFSWKKLIKASKLL